MRQSNQGTLHPHGGGGRGPLVFGAGGVELRMGVTPRGNCMALPSTGLISLGMINTELTKTATTPISLNDAAVRLLAGKASGPISLSDLRGKTFYPTGILVAGTKPQGARTEIGYRDSGPGTLTELPGAPAKPAMFIESNNSDGSLSSASIGFLGSYGTQLTGKAVYVNDVRIAMNTPTVVKDFYGNWETYWISPTRFGLVAGQTYRVRVGV